MEVSEIHLYNTLRNKLEDQETQDFINFMKATVKKEFMDQKQIFLTKDDKIDIMRSIYLVGIVQYIAIVGSLLAIHSFILKH